MPENILNIIVEHKIREVKAAKKAMPEWTFESAPFFNRPTLSLKKSLTSENSTGIIAEFKRKSPSKGIFNADAQPEIITKAYSDQGASGLSILTDETFFAGNNEDLKKARFNEVPILRKDFMIDEYQVLEARAIGADVILLIAACLSPERTATLASLAKSLGLEVLLEIHNEAELEQVTPDIDIVGVNNRDLKTFTVDLNLSLSLSEKIPADKVKISESGISSIQTIRLLKRAGFQGFLIGENFMKEPDPSIAFARFVQQLKIGNV